MKKNIINIGIPSKGRLRKDILKIFKKNKLNLVSERGERDLLGSIKNLSNVKVLYLHAREIIERLGDGSLDLGFSGYDLLKESEVNIQKKISVVKGYGFGKATLVVAIPDPWIDVQTIADLEEIAFYFKDKKKKREPRICRIEQHKEKPKNYSESKSKHSRRRCEPSKFHAVVSKLKKREI